MDYRLNLKDLTQPQDIARLVTAISEIADECDVLYTSTDPNGNISGRQGRIALYKNGANYEIKVNTDGATAWQRIDYAAYTEPFQVGDWIISSVTTARTGWSNVSATYSNKFIRINATPLTTGGSDTDSITLTTTELPAHTHNAGTYAAANESAHTHTIPLEGGGTGFVDTSATQGTAAAPPTITSSGGSAHGHAISGASASAGTGTAFTVDTVPAYVSVVIWQKD